MLSSVRNARTGVTMTIKWQSVPGAAKYRIYRKTGSGNWKKLVDTEKTSFTDKKVSSGTKYSYRVRCINSKGKLVNTYSSTKSITRYAAPVIRTTTPTKGKITVTWKKVNGAERYNVYRKSGNGKYILVSIATKNSFVDRDVKAGKRYTYEIAVVNTSGKVLSVHSRSQDRR